MSELTRQLASLSADRLAIAVQRLREQGGGDAVLASEPIAIVGMACRFPNGADTPEKFWAMLRAGADGITEVPRERWDMSAYFDPDPDAPARSTTRWGSFLSDIDQFDAAFFHISPREARSMDPQQRLLLEVAWEALEDAGEVPTALAGSRTGVFMGVCSNDYGQRIHDPAQIDAYFGTGNNASVAAGRISYVLGLQGPAVAIDTACSASLAAVHLACQSLRNGEADMALAGGVNVILRPDGMIYFSKLRAMAADGRCKTFSAEADGYVRGEGCGVVVMKRLASALAAGDRILAVVRGSAMNQDGRSNGLTAPSGPAQEAVIRAALQNGQVLAEQVSYVEAHGTGTPLGDPIEMQSLARVYAAGRAPADALWVGSLKTNVGHLEAAAGIAGLIKTVLALQHREIPAHLHFVTPSPHIPWQEIAVRIPTALTPWRAERRLAGVSSFGFSGTNVHVVLEEFAPSPLTTSTPQPLVLLLSARTPAALNARVQQFRDLLPTADDVSALCYTAAVRRPHHAYRVSITGQSGAELAGALSAAAATPHGAHHHCGTVEPDTQRRVVFVFPGQGGQWAGMGRALLQSEPVFRAAFEACAQAIRACGGPDIELLLHADDASFADQAVDEVQPLLFGVQVALAALLQSWDVVPNAVAGHSMGEAAAAHVAGALSLADAALVICQRSRLARRLRGAGAMAVVELPRAEAETLLASYDGRIGIAAENGPRTTLLTGEPNAIEQLLADLEQRGEFARRVRVDYASHAPAVEPLLPELRAALSGLAPNDGSCRFYSSVLGEPLNGSALNAEYWLRNLREPVRFWPTIARLYQDGIDTFVEISPHPVVLGAIQDGLTTLGASNALAVACTRRAEPERLRLLDTAGALHTHGVPVAWSRVLPATAPVSLPPYPWQRERFWLEPTETSAAASAHALLATRVETAAPVGVVWNAPLRQAATAWLDDHQVDGAAVMPGAAYIDVALAVAQEQQLAVERVAIDHLLFTPSDDARLLQTRLHFTDAGAELSISAGRDREWVECARASFIHQKLVDRASVDVNALQRRATAVISADAFYGSANATGVQLGAAFRGLREIHICGNEVLAAVELPELDATHFCWHPAALDLGLQALANVLLADASATETWLPIGCGAVTLHGSLAALRWIHASVDKRADDQRSGTIRFLDGNGQPLCVINELQFRRLAGRIETNADAWLDHALWQVEWQATAPPEFARNSAHIVVVGAPADEDPLVLDLLRRGTDAFRVRTSDHEFAHATDVVFLPPVLAADETAPVTAKSEAIRLLALTQQLLRDYEAPPRLWLVMRDALAHAPLRGLARTIMLERPQLHCTILELPPTATDATALWTELHAALPVGIAEQIAWRNDQRLVARLQPRQRTALERRNVEIRLDAKYVVTGGTGALGLRTIAWLRERGARHVAVISRTAPRADWQADTRVTHYSADVTDPTALSSALERVRAAGPAIRGVIHAAGTMQDALLPNLDAATLQSVLAPKVQGAWQLHQQTGIDPLDFFVMFSSTAGVLGAPGQANYAAANAFLDALAEARANAGLPALAIAWGAWSDAGLAATRERGERLQERGINSIAPGQGIAALDFLLAARASHVLVLPLDAQRWQKTDPLATAQPLFTRVLGEQPVARTIHDERAEILAAPAMERRARLQQLVAQQIGAVTGQAASRIEPRTPLGSLGIDSLMAVEIRNRLETLLHGSLPATMVWRYPTVAKLAEGIAERLGISLDAIPATSAVEEGDELTELLQAEIARARAVRGES